MAIRHYVLLATDGFIDVPTIPDICPLPETRRKIYVFGFMGGLFKVDGKIVNPVFDWKNSNNWSLLRGLRGKATIPSPMIWGEIGDNIYITLINLGMEYRSDLMDPHTVHLHGAHVATQLDGFPETSFSVPLWMDGDSPPPNATYFFEPERPGTYMYHCHVEAAEHVQMGMYGALVVYPSMRSLCEAGISRTANGKWFCRGVPQHHIPPTATNRNFAYNDVNTYFDKEYVMLLSDIDSGWHDAVLQAQPFNAVNFRPDYWLVNGRAFPDTLLPHPQSVPTGSDPSLSQIGYESYVHVKTGDLLLLRMINMGYQLVPWHIHGWNFAVVGKDTHPSPFLKLNSPFGILEHDMLEMGFTAAIASGETYELLIHADDKQQTYRNYIVRGQDGLPSLCSQMSELDSQDPSAIADIPTEPVFCPYPNTLNYIGICQQPPSDPNTKFFPQFYPMHNHDDYKVTNNGIYPGGQMTFMQVDAPIY